MPGDMQKSEPEKKPKRSWRSLIVYENVVTGQKRWLVPLWLLVMFFGALLVYYMSAYQMDLFLKFIGSGLNYMLPIFYIFLIISYFIFDIANQIQH
jgi:hypothetical protein